MWKKRIVYVQKFSIKLAAGYSRFDGGKLVRSAREHCVWTEWKIFDNVFSSLWPIKIMVEENFKFGG